jgi:predicted ATPase/DNA-binding SARP family transcriptional activator
MTQLNITLLGSPLIYIDGKPLNSRAEKSAAMVALLALRGPTLYRQDLIANLWSRSETSKAQAALRTALWRIKEAGLSPWLEIERESITLKTDGQLWVDIKEFQKNLEESRSHPHSHDIACPSCFPLLSRAVELYRGDFMSGYSPHHAAGFEEWRSEYSNILRSEYLNTLERLAKGYYQHGQLGQALQITRRWLAVDSLNEYAHALAIRLFASNGQRANAIAQYRAYKQLVEQELKIDPSSELTALYNQILAGKIHPIATTSGLKTPILLLLDIAHGTELWISYPDLMKEVQARFIQLVKDLLRQCGARILHQSGHQLSILIERGHPLQCVIAIQEMVARSQWGLPVPLSVRMALTTLPRSPAQSPLHSTQYTICKQLLYAASGNQVLLTSQAVLELEFPVSSRTHDLGSYFFTGVDNPVQVLELVHPHFPSSGYQSLPHLTRPPDNLPLQLTCFVGHKDALNHITTLLDQPDIRLLTLVGPGGVGKTRLGIQVLRQIPGNQYDGIYYVPLVNKTNPLTLHEPIADVLHLAFNNPGDQVLQLKQHLQGKRILLMLDNFEHLLEGTPLLIDLLESTPGLRILLTSRERLNLQMETIFEVHGLSIPQDPNDPGFKQSDAVNLFTQNAQRVFPRFTIRPEDREHIIQICSLVDGLPIGIELASSWVRSISCQEISRSIKKNLDFLQTNSQDVPPRHRSLRAAFDHTWKLLSEEDRRTIGKLSIFRAGFSSEAGDKLCNATPTMLASYVDKSILISQTVGRHLMPETLRTYVIQILETDPREYDLLSQAHCEYYLNYLISSLPKFASPNGAAAIKGLWPDAANIRLALNWAIDQHQWTLFYHSIDPLMTFFELQGRFREGLENAQKLQERFVNLIGKQQPDIYYSLLGWEGWFAFRSGFYQQGLDKLNSSLEYARRQDDFAHVAYSLLLLSEAHVRRGNPELALQEIEQSLAIMEQYFDFDNSLMLAIHGSGLSLYGLILFINNRMEDARLATDKAADALRRSGSRYGLIRLLDVQARLVNREKKFKEGYNLRLEELAIAEEFNDRRCIASALNNLGSTSTELGDLQAAFNYTLKSAQVSDEIGDRQAKAISNNNLGYYMLQLNHPPQNAIPYYEKSLAMFRDLDDTYGVFYTLRDLSRACVLAHRPALAQKHLCEAIQLGSALNNPLLVLHLLPVIARLLAQTDHVDHAYQLCTIVLHHPQAEPDLQHEAQSLLAEFEDHTDPGLAPWSGSGEPTLPTFQALLAVVRQHFESG